MWALPAEVWEQGTLNGRPIPQIASLSQAVHTGKESSKKHVETAEWSLIARDGSTEISTAAEACASAVGRQAIK